jgi:hypothetical protein
MGLFYPRSHPTCTKCQNARVRSLPSTRYNKFKKVLNSPDRPYLPYSIVEDDLLTTSPDASPAYDGGALIRLSKDSPSIPQDEMEERLFQLRGWASQEESMVASALTGLTNRSSRDKVRPLILFPHDNSGAQVACVMATFSSGKIMNGLTKSFACGVWPTVTHGYNSVGLHIHTTPPWQLSPQFVLAITYTPQDVQGPWFREPNQTVDYHLDLDTTNTLTTLCDRLATTWLATKVKQKVSGYYLRSLESLL